MNEPTKTIVLEHAATERINVVVGDQENSLDKICRAVFRHIFPDNAVQVILTTYVDEFIAAASKPDTHLAIFVTGANLKPGSGDPVPTRQLAAPGIIAAIKQKRCIPVFAFSIEPDIEPAVMAAGADAFLPLPVSPRQLAAALAQCLKLKPKPFPPL